ncbi:hypothetical protein CP556_07355 [Natrinema sp. CBA1119]|uniref:DUF5518 domain-containing protein n=1 Tax=Natrinema sp. CBA1119 TaxID=1608465 RepID=UPI000BF3981C|nr:DUF5518 domain-containing protein [Natrinema sp. CBA1119]PGF15951.1 hypothetical protein CP556_07355 [Natrinema sp. CBA1119]
MVRSRTIVNAGIGAIIGVVLSFIPFSPVLGGAVAGFLEGPDERAGAVAGALAGAIAFLPIAGIGFLLFGFLSLGLAGGVPVEGVALFALVILGVGAFILLYTVGLSLLGGYLGAYLAREYPDSHRRTRETVGFETNSADGSRTSDSTATRDREFGHESDSALEGGDSSRRQDDRYADGDRDRGSEREPK